MPQRFACLRGHQPPCARRLPREQRPRGIGGEAWQVRQRRAGLRQFRIAMHQYLAIGASQEDRAGLAQAISVDRLGQMIDGKPQTRHGELATTGFRAR
jgi:hypothetical protein